MPKSIYQNNNYTNNVKKYTSKKIKKRNKKRENAKCSSCLLGWLLDTFSFINFDCKVVYFLL